MSKTEWGYGGGRYVDRHCRWCDKIFSIPKDEEIFPFEVDDIIGESGFENENT
jgi:hypothetical protein